MINYIYYPNNEPCPKHLLDLCNCFQNVENKISSNNKDLSSNQVLSELAEWFKNLGYKVEESKRKEDKIHVPVLFGNNNKVIKEFQADAYNEAEKTVIEVEAGRGVLNNQFLKDYFEACMMVNVEYCVIAVRNKYKGNDDFKYVKNTFDSLYTSGRIKTTLKGVCIIGY